MTNKPHIIRMVADRACKLYYGQNKPRATLPSPRILEDEIGVRFADGRFIPYADLGFHRDRGFYRLSETFDVPNESAPFAAGGKLLHAGQVIVTTGVSARLSPGTIRALVDRHTAGDYGSHGDFYDIDVTDDLLRLERLDGVARGVANKVNTLTGLNAVHSEYVVDGQRIWVVTEAGDNRTTVLMYAGPVPEG